MKHGSLFSGIGGFDLAAEWAGIENIFQVEIDPFCQKILNKNFPNTKKYTDIKEFNANEYRRKVDIISGGFPCQPFSTAGKRQGIQDERALFPEMVRIIRETEPKWIIAENVGGILNINNGKYYEEICTSLENEKYTIQSFIIPATFVNAPHRRERLWLIAYNNRFRFTQPTKFSAEQYINFLSENFRCWEKAEWDIANNRFKGKKYDYQPILCRNDDGVSNRVDRLRTLGNTIVPQIAYIFFEIIKMLSMNIEIKENNLFSS